MGGNKLAYINLGRYKKQIAGLKELVKHFEAQLKERDAHIKDLELNLKALQDLNRRR